MLVKRIINSIFKSNTYILFTEEDPQVWVVDPGDSEPIFTWLESNKKYLEGIFITHSHFDHIYGVNDLIAENQNISLYASEQAAIGFNSEKYNGSLYMDMPFIIERKEYLVLGDNHEVKLFNNGLTLKVLYTPGHNNDCLTFQIDSFIFSGDALLPGAKIHTKSKYSNKVEASQSIQRIYRTIDIHTILCPGHGDLCYCKNLTFTVN